MADYSLALKRFEDETGLVVDENFKHNFSESKLSHTVPLINLLNQWRSDFESVSLDSHTTSLSIAEDNSYLIRRSCLYSSNIVLHGGGTVEDEYWGTYTPDHYFHLLTKYHELIRENICCIVPDTFEKTCSEGKLVEEITFLPKKFGAISISSKNRNYIRGNQTKDLHFKVFLPDVRGLNNKDLISLIKQEEIFHQYHDALNALNLKNESLDNESKLKEIMLEVDDKTRELNSKFETYRKNKAWQALKATLGFSLTGASFFLPPDIGMYVRSVLGTLSVISASDSAIGMVQTKSELAHNPYYFSYLVGDKSNLREE